MSPLLFIFRKVIQCDCTDTNFENEEYDFLIDTDWRNYWRTKGDEIVNISWSKKYSDFLLNEDKNITKSEKDHQIIEKEIKPKTVYSSQDNSVGKEKVNELTEEVKTYEEDSVLEETSYSDLWQELWDIHYSEIYQKTYETFSIAHYKYYNFHRPNKEFIEEESYWGHEILDERQQLEAFGLPTSFGGKNNKYFRIYDSSEDSTDESNKETQMVSSQRDVKQKRNKKKNRKTKRMPKFLLEDKSLQSYWYKRFSLFSKFDDGIQLDKESWFSVTPEKVAIHMAERLRCGIIIDAFCGSGGNSIQFAKTCKKVIAIDIDPEKIKNAQNNAIIYGVAEKIDFIIGDFLQLCNNLKGDIVFLSPPWGGPKYALEKQYDIEESLEPVSASLLIEKCRKINENIAFFLPRNSNREQIAKLAGIGKRVEVEHNYLNTKLVGLTAIYGDWLIDKLNLVEDK